MATPRAYFVTLTFDHSAAGVAGAPTFEQTIGWFSGELQAFPEIQGDRKLPLRDGTDLERSTAWTSRGGLAVGVALWIGSRADLGSAVQMIRQRLLLRFGKDYTSALSVRFAITVKKTVPGASFFRSFEKMTKEASSLPRARRAR